MREHYQNQSGTSENTIFRFTPIPSLISLAIVALTAWGLSWIPSIVDMKIGIAVAFGLSSACFLLTAINIGESRSTTVLKTTASVFLCLTLLLDIALAVWCIYIRTVILANALILLIFILIAYSIAKTKQ